MQHQSSCFMLAVLLSCVLSTVLATPIPAHATAGAHSAAAEEAEADAATTEEIRLCSQNATSGGEDLAETEAPDSSNDTVVEEDDDASNATDHTGAPGGSNQTEAKSGKEIFMIEIWNNLEFDFI